MMSREFEMYVGNVFEKLGFGVNVTQATRDGGKDIIATKKFAIPYTVYIECKHKKEGNKVGVDVIRSSYGVQMAKRVNQSIVVTSTSFTKDACEFAQELKDWLC